MTVFLSVLKIIGIVLGIILLVLIGLIAVILFVPIRYRADGTVEEKRYAVKLSWLLHVVGFTFHMEGGETEYYLSLFGRRTHILDPDRRKEKKAKKKKKSKKKKNRKKDKKNNQKIQKSDSEGTQSEATASGADDRSLNGGEDQTSADASFGSIQSEDKRREHDSSADRDTGAEEESSGSGLFEKLSGTVPGRAAGKALGILKKIYKIIKTYHPVSLVWPKLRKFLYRIRPRQIRGDIVFGFDDPSLTGKVIGAVSSIYFLYQYEDFHLSGDFETDQTYISGSFSVIGHIRLFALLLLIIGLMRKKEFRNLIAYLKE